jgi:hypothetical protein
MFFRAVPVQMEEPRAADVGIVRAEWVDPRQLTAESTCAFLHPLLGLAADDSGAPSYPIMFRAEHRRDASGRRRPHIVPDVPPPAV